MWTVASVYTVGVSVLNKSVTYLQKHTFRSWEFVPEGINYNYYNQVVNLCTSLAFWATL